MLMGVEIDDLDERELIAHVVTAFSGGEGGWLVNPNVDVLRQIDESPEVHALVASADLVVADGMPLIWASRLQRTPLPERVAGASLIWTLSEAAAAAGIPIFLLGGAPGIGEQAAARLRDAISELVVAGTYSPPFGFEQDPDAIALIDEHLDAAGPSIVFCGFGFPKQERLMAVLAPAHPTSWFIGSGASLTMAAGDVDRAPEWMQQSGLEWLFRLRQEPKRLFSRYIVHDIPFAVRMLSRSAAARMTVAGDSR
jgi:N-acetylglucosaminyldiphosphoundecaprenol N-acetyl-beta-D-mannosaminyltransferase